MKKKPEIDPIDIGLKLAALAVTLIGGAIGSMQTKRYLDRMVDEKLNNPETED